MNITKWFKKLLRWPWTIGKQHENPKKLVEDALVSWVIAPITNQPGKYLFYCPGCQCNHTINTTTGNKPHHILTGSFNAPTIRASVLVKENYNSDIPRCHAFITDGKIEFLDDCTHELAGKTVDMVIL